MTKKYITKDSGKRVDYPSGMRRDTEDNKPRYDLIYHPMIKRLALLMSRGAVKYGQNNWQKANSIEELIRFKASFLRHVNQFANYDDTEEDHAAAILFNIGAILYLSDKLGIEDISMQNLFKLIEGKH